MSASVSIQESLQADLDILRSVKSAPPTLIQLVALLRREMEPAPGTEVPKTRNFSGGDRGDRGDRGQAGRSWRSGVENMSSDSQRVFVSRNGERGGDRGDRGGGGGMHRNNSSDSFPGSMSSGSRTPVGTPTPRPPVGRYQSKFTSGSTNLEDKILNTVIGNKLNSFTKLTYTDVRDFIYQILDSGETEFIKDFVDKVFKKATVEELYCALFAQLIAEIAHRYPVIYEEMARYHQQFLTVFEDVQEGGGEGSIQARAYRLGYGQFLSELAGQNALEKKQLFAMVEKVVDRIWTLTAIPEKSKTVEEFADCLVRLTQSLKQKTPAYFRQVHKDLQGRILEKSVALVKKQAGDRPSLSTKAKCALMDLNDLLV